MYDGSERDSNYIIDEIIREMPGIKQANWEFSASKRKLKMNTGQDRLLQYVEIMPPGEMLGTTVRDNAKISVSYWKQLCSRHLSDGKSALRRALTERGVTVYQARNRRWYFSKS